MSRMLKVEEVGFKVGLSKATIYRRIKEGTFPKPLKISYRVSGWNEEVINDWILSLNT